MKQYNTNEKKMQEALIDKDGHGKERPWRDKKMRNTQLTESYGRLAAVAASRSFDDYYHYSARAAVTDNCSRYLQFKRFEDGTMKLHYANFCKARLCPMCAWRNTLKAKSELSRVMEVAEKKRRFVFLTLTVRNVEGHRLSNAIDELFGAYQRLTQTQEVRRMAKGWFRVLEVTHNLDKASDSYDTYHPHIHVIVAVNLNYFIDSKQYIRHSRWLELWQRSLRVDYAPSVRVQVVKNAGGKGVKEVAKYSVKDSEYIISRDEEMTDRTVAVLDVALHNRRLVAYSGELRKIYKELALDKAPDDLVVVGDDVADGRDGGCELLQFNWHVGYKNYVMVAKDSQL